jgi:Uma2 family endonuclease
MTVAQSRDSLSPSGFITPAQFEQLCQNNPDIRMELTATGELVTMAPAGWESSKQNGNLFVKVWLWNDQTKLGEVFDSSGGFTLPNGAIKSPDVTWISRFKLENFSTKVAFPLVVPDFVIELRSKSDRLNTLQEKMLEYRDNGVSLGILVNPQDRQVEVYRLGQEVQISQSPVEIDCKDILPDFRLDLTGIFTASIDLD